MNQTMWPPTTEMEKELCSIWQSVLGLEKVGITDDFFRIGGDSILSILFKFKAKKSRASSSVKDIFEKSNNIRTCKITRSVKNKSQAINRTRSIGRRI